MIQVDETKLDYIIDGYLGSLDDCFYCPCYNKCSHGTKEDCQKNVKENLQKVLDKSH